MPRSSLARRLTILAVGSTLALSTGGALSAVAASKAHHHQPVANAANADRTVRTGVDRSSVIVRLQGRPLATAASTRPANGRSINFRSAAVKNQKAVLAAQRSAFRKWLSANAPKAVVTGHYDVALNGVAVRLHGTSASTLRKAPGVTAVRFQQTYRPTAADPDLALIQAEQAWAAVGGPSNAGTGVQVGIVDTGIDVTHPCFDDAGYPATTQRGDTRFTNNKVIVAKVFYNKAANGGLTAEAVQEHGTHVAGTVACNYRTPATVQGVAIPYDPSGVAPRALLGNYNVFPGEVANARSEDIMNALQAAAEDGMDVINMSLGGNAHGNDDLLTNVVDNLDKANIVVAVAAGNSGPGHFTVESPGSAARALSAGASSVGHFVGVPVTSGGSTFAAAVGDFPLPPAALTAPLSLAAGSPLGNGCTADQFGAGTAGTIALIARGTCTFSQKVATAEAAGAVAVVIVNNVAGDPVAMATDPTFPSTIPAVQVGLATRDALVALDGADVTLGVDAEYVLSGNDDIMAGFSSQGPTDVDFGVKPDVVAPGVNVLSSIPHQFCDAPPCWAFFQGTSMATPHLAGSAATVRSAHPGWTAAQVRSAIVNTAQEGVLTAFTDGTTTVTDPNIIGSGLEDLLAAVGAQVAVGPVSTSFGAVPGRNSAAQQRAVTVTNLTGSALTLSVSVTGSAAFSASPSSVTVAAGGSATVTVRFNPKAAALGDNSATLRLGDAAHAVLYALVK